MANADSYTGVDRMCLCRIAIFVGFFLPMLGGEKGVERGTNLSGENGRAGFEYGEGRFAFNIHRTVK